MVEHEVKPVDTENDKPRIGVYICHCGGNISDTVDVKKVAENVSHLPNVVISRDFIFMCSDPGQNVISKDIQNEKLNRVIVAACSPSLHENTFRLTLSRAGVNPYLYEHCNIREQVSWVSQSDPVGATDKAIRLVAAAIGKARRLKALDPIRVDAETHVVVVGGGISGLQSARELSRRGLKVTLLEQTPFLGGRMSQLDQVFPTQDKARDLLHISINDVANNPNITLYTLAEIHDVSGYIGNFNLQVTLHPRGFTEEFDSHEITKVIDACPLSIKNEFDHGITSRKAIYQPYPGCYPPTPAIDWNICDKCGLCVHALEGKGIELDETSQEIELNAGAIVLATGFDVYEPHHREFGYAEYPEVITLPQLIRLLDEEGPTQGCLELDGRQVENICMIHCVGSRQKEEIHAAGQNGRLNEYCSRVCCTATLQAAVEIHDRFPHVNIYDFYQDIRTYGRGHEDYYRMASERGVLFFRYAAEEPPEVRKNEHTKGSPLTVHVKDSLTFGEEIEVPADLIVLATGIVPRENTALVEALKLPKSTDGFLQEVHPKLRPVELAIKGVFVAGTCQAPMDITESCAASAAAASKTAVILSKGHIELDPFVARVDPHRCKGEGKCAEECKFTHAISIIEKEYDGIVIKQAQVNPALCRGCGMCAAVCPHGAIQVDGWRLDQFEAMVDAIAGEY